MKTNRRLVQVKVEATPGTPAVPNPATDALMAVDFKWDNAAEPVTDEFKYAAGYYGAKDSFTVSLSRRCSFTLPVVGGGTPLGTNLPAPLLAMYRAAGHAAVVTAATSVVFNPVSDAMEAATLLVNDDGFLRRMTYCRGDVNWLFEEGKVPRANFSLLGTYETPTDQAMPAATMPTLQKPQGFNKSNSVVTLGALALKCQRVEIRAGRQNSYRNFAGAEDVVPTDAEAQAILKFELPTVAQSSVYADLETNQVRALSLTHGQVAGNRVAFGAAAAQLVTLSEEEDRGILMVTATYNLKPQAGNDQYLITLT